MSKEASHRRPPWRDDAEAVSEVEGDKSSSGKSAEWLREKFQTSRQRKG